VLLETREVDRILMAVQRYGAGKVAFFAPHASWRWRAHTPVEEEAYERFWTQMIRWLAAEKERPVALEMERFSFDLGEPLHLRTRVFDAAYRPNASAQVSATIRDAQGDVHMVVLEPALGEAGMYEGMWEPSSEGAYQVDVWADQNGTRIGDARGYFEVQASHVELEGSLSNRPLLERICRASGGILFDQEEAESVPDRIPYLPTTTSRTVQVDIWNTPWVFFAILCLMSGEWLLRRRRGML
jgi:hypothetical protein